MCRAGGSCICNKHMFLLLHICKVNVQQKFAIAIAIKSEEEENERKLKNRDKALCFVVVALCACVAKWPDAGICIYSYSYTCVSACAWSECLAARQIGDCGRHKCVYTYICSFMEVDLLVLSKSNACLQIYVHACVCVWFLKSICLLVARNCTLTLFACYTVIVDYGTWAW